MESGQIMQYINGLNFLKELSKIDFFNSEIIIKQYITNTKKFNVTLQLVKQLDEQYEKLCNMSKEYRNKSAEVIPTLNCHYISMNPDALEVVYFNS